MKNAYCIFPGKLCALFTCLLCANILNAQLRFSELSPDSGNNDGTNDGIVELINIGNTPYDAGCYVISNSEWLVVLPPGTIIQPGAVFLIACSEGQNTGTNPNPIPGSGLACATCDFPNLPIDFDVCDPANANFINWAATGFTIDNQSNTDGDQIVLFSPDGTIIQAAKWNGGATSVFDNTAVQSGPYTLGTPGTGGAGLSSAQLPNALLPGGLCYDANVMYIMPMITDPVYEDLSSVPNPGGKAINAGALQGCNSSYIYDPATDSWRKTDYPTPGLPNDTPAYQYSFSAPLMQCAHNIESVIITLEVNNWQAVTPDVLNAKGGVGSFVSFDGGTTTIPWDTYARNDAIGVTTLTYTFMPSGNGVLSLVWNDDNSSALASTPTGSNSTTAVVRNTTPSDCYTIEQYNIRIIENMMVSQTDITCPADFMMGTINVGALTTGGLHIFYELFDNGVSQALNNTGIFSVPNDFNGPITVVVNDASGCSNPAIIQVNNNCRQAPICPDNLAYDACTTPAGATCPGDIIMLGLNADDLPVGGIIEWVQLNNPDDDPYHNGNVIATQNIIQTISSPDCPADGAQVVINRIIIRPAMNDGGGGDEYFQLVNLGPCSADISGYRFTYGSSGFGSVFTQTVAANTILACGEFYSANSNVAFSNSNGGFWLVNSANEVIQSIGYGSGSTGGMSGGITYPATTGNLGFTSSNRGIYRNASCVYAASNVEIPFGGSSPNSPETGGQCPANCSGTAVTTLEPACATHTIPADACNSTLHVRPRIAPVDASCNNPTLAARSYTITCPIATLSGGDIACAGSSVPLTIDFDNYAGNPSFTIEYTIDGQPQTPIMTMDDPYILNAATAGEYILTSVAVNGDNCTATASGSAIVQINENPMATLSGTIDEVCIDGFANIPLTIGQGTLPMIITYDLDGGTPQMVEIFSAQLNIATNGLDANETYTINIIAIIDDNGCVGTASGSAIINTINCSFICPTITALTAPDEVCLGNNFDIEATGLADMAMTDNSEADFGIAFVYFAGATPPANPYLGGTLLGMVAHAALAGTSPNQTASLQNVNINTVGTYQLCAILNVSPDEEDCQPFVCQTLTVAAAPIVALNESPRAICSTQKLSLQLLDGSITLDGQPYTGTWSILEADTDGTFLDANLTDLGTTAAFGVAVFYQPGDADAQRGFVTLVLTSDDPDGACPPASATANVRVLRVNCGNFPWPGSDN
ncbi:MAG TPA: hypothetical protein PKC76_03910 [Saprospiraceae bacterium]|nr:hypothetical protein [Saprospiraceae bacterium]